MSPVNGIAQLMGRWNVPLPVENAFMATNKEGPMAVLPLEASTTVGRSVSSARRNGFLEFQERFLEEIAVAIVWLYGVSFMNNRFNQQIKPRIFPKAAHLDPDTAWDFKAKGTYQNVDLLPSQRFTLNAAEKNQLTKIKGVGLLLSVGTATATAALVIPWANKKKTEWLVKYLDKKESASSQWQKFSPEPRHNAGHAQQAGMPYLHSHGSTPRPFQSNAPSFSPFTQAYGSIPSTAQAAYPDTATTSTLTPAALKFGLGSNALSILQKVGHGVQQTNYGELLAVDGGLAGGRIVVYGDRSPYEAAEIALRDIGSIYFYMFSAPHIMRLSSYALRPMLHANVLLEPKVGRAVQQTILNNLLDKHQSELSPKAKAALEKALKNPDPRGVSELLKGADGQTLAKELQKIQLTPEDFEVAVKGRAHPVSTEIQKELQTRWLQADKNSLLPLLKAETAAYKTPKAYQALADTIGRLPGNVINTDQLHTLLNEIEQGQGAFNQLTIAERTNADTDLRQAFRHRVGMSFNLDELKSQAILQKIANQLPESERTAFWNRAQLMARQDSRNIANSMFRRSLVLGLESSKSKGNFSGLGEQMATWLERANARQQTLGQVGQHALDELADRLEGFSKKGRLKHVPNLQSHLKTLRSGKPNAIQTTLGHLQNHLSNFKPGMWNTFVDGYLSRSGIPSQIDDLIALFHPNSHNGSIAELTRHLNQTAQGEALETLANKNINAYFKALADVAQHANPGAGLISQYAKEFPTLLSGQEGRLLSLFTTQAKAPLDAKLHAFLSGGIQADEQLISQGLEITGKLKLHSRMFNSPKAHEIMTQQIRDWSEDLLTHLGDKPLTGEALVKSMENYRRVSQSGHIIARMLAMGISMVGLGVLIPKLQYALTKKLTGKDEHPGIATLHHSDEHTSSWQHKKHKKQPANTSVFA